MLIDKEYQVRGDAYKLERNAIERWQYFLSGAGIDVTIKERLAEQTKTPMQIPLNLSGKPDILMKKINKPSILLKKKYNY